MKVIVPCAGKSSHFPNMRPKWMLTHPDGNMMVKEAIEGLNIKPKDVIITILKEPIVPKEIERYDHIKIDTSGDTEGNVRRTLEFLLTHRLKYHII